MKRYGLVAGLGCTSKLVAAYLPANYKVIYEITGPAPTGHLVVIEGIDNYGWGLDSYVIPRLASGCLGCREIDLSHPVMSEIPA